MAELGIKLAEKLMEVAGSATIKKNLQIFGYNSQLEDFINTVSALKNVLFDVYSKQKRLSHESRGYITDLKAALHDTYVIFYKLFTDLVEKKKRLDPLDANKEGQKLSTKVRLFSSKEKRLFLTFVLTYKIYRLVKVNKKKLDAMLSNLHKFGLSVVDYNPICSIREENLQDQGNFHVSLSTTSSNNSFEQIPKTITSKTLGNTDFLKWVFVVLNVVVELCQATFSQVKNQRKMGPNIYFKLSITTSSICLMMAIFEAFHQGKGAGIVWQKRGYCCWFYYPGNEGRLFGRFSLYFGLISSMIQLTINVIQKLTNKDIVKFDYIPLLLAICYLVAAIIGTQQEKTPSVISIRCNVHGSSVVEGTIVEGHESRVFQCPHCQREREEDRVLNRC